MQTKSLKPFARSILDQSSVRIIARFLFLIWNTFFLKKKDQIMNSIQDQLNQLRVGLGWQSDLDEKKPWQPK